MHANTTGLSDKLVTMIIAENNTVKPLLLLTKRDISLDHVNLDSASVAGDSNYLSGKNCLKFKSQNPTIEWIDPLNPRERNLYYYGHTSRLLSEVRYYPLVQLLIVALFIYIILYSVSLSNRSTQNQVWAGMAKETAHQLGTPFTSLEGWVEMMKENQANEPIVG